MKTCPKCHKKNENDNKFCIYCGTLISKNKTELTREDNQKVYMIKLGFEEVNKIKLNDDDMYDLPTRELKRYYKVGYDIVNKIDLIKIGFKKKNKFELSNEDMSEIPQHELNRYYRAGLRATKKRFIE